MTGRQLFNKRLMEELRFQSGVIRSVVDWTIALYIVMPALVAAVMVYKEAWQNISLYWHEDLPFLLLLVLVFLFSLTGNFRTYIMEADLLYVIQREKLLYGLKLHAFIFSIIQMMLQLLILFICMLPILVKAYHLPLIEILFLYIAVFCFRLFLMTLKKILNRNMYKWTLFPLTSIIFILFILNLPYVIYGIGSVITIFSIVYFHMKQLRKTNRWFLKELEIEDRERVRYIQLIMSFSTEVEKAPNRLRKTPFIFPKSKRIFSDDSPEIRLLELLLKSFLRNKATVFAYLQITMITFSAIIIVPVLLKWIIFICFIFFIHYWLHHLYRKMLDSPFFAIIPIDEKYSAWSHFRKYLLFPPVIVFALTVIFITIRFIIV
ncbi:ABC transporter permease [Metabacillus fastidiosus]|uniref:ABC transporter permease n=1 Tax=Metabacillus fastidiosus TaxID=1458 RepID=UPI002DB5F82D|nr:ABC transporter permease [Metabacillus fastidiosus]MEC2074866.1 ABC transporter permease [Metabacillus fastidiosus]